MSFQSFAKIPPPPKHRPKNLPSLDLIALLHSLCQDSPNDYDARNHVVTINSMEAFEHALRQKANRSLTSFEKQLKMLGYKKHRYVLDDIKMEYNGDEEQKWGTKYYWRGQKEDYLNKDLGFIEKHLSEFIGKVANFRQNLNNSKEKIDKNFENALFSGLRNGVQSEKTENKMNETRQLAIDSINKAHKTSSELVKEVQLNLEDEISLLRLLSFRHGEIYDQ